MQTKNKVLIGLGVLAAGGTGYYFLVHKKKKEETSPNSVLTRAVNSGLLKNQNSALKGLGTTSVSSQDLPVSASGGVINNPDVGTRLIETMRSLNR